MKKAVNRFIFRRYFDNEQEYHSALRFMAQDSVKTGMVSLRAIILFEFIMILVWFLSGNDFADKYSRMYLASYVFLLVVSIVVHSMVSHAIQRQESLEKSVKLSSYIYNFMLLTWALFITYLDITKSGYFSSMVYMTIIVIIPVVAFIEPIYYLILNILGSATVISFLLIFCELSENRGNFINFLVFALISMLAGCAYLIVRVSGYVNRVKLEEANNKLLYAAEHDFLSGLYNRQKLGLLSEDIWKQCMEHHEKLSCVLCDLDNFKKFNDDYGHDCGDECICLVAKLLGDVLQEKGAKYFRYGGEEFLVLFPEKSYEYAYELMEIIQDRLRSAKLENVDENCKVTMSVGIYTGVPDKEHAITQYFSKADQYMYEAKMNGKNCIRGVDES